MRNQGLHLSLPGIHPPCFPLRSQGGSDGHWPEAPSAPWPLLTWPCLRMHKDASAHQGAPSAVVFFWSGGQRGMVYLSAHVPGSPAGAFSCNIQLISSIDRLHACAGRRTVIDTNHSFFKILIQAHACTPRNVPYLAEASRRKSEGHAVHHVVSQCQKNDDLCSLNLYINLLSARGAYPWASCQPRGHTLGPLGPVGVPTIRAGIDLGAATLAI